MLKFIDNSRIKYFNWKPVMIYALTEKVWMGQSFLASTKVDQ